MVHEVTVNKKFLFKCYWLVKIVIHHFEKVSDWFETPSYNFDKLFNDPNDVILSSSNRNWSNWEKKINLFP